MSEAIYALGLVILLARIKYAWEGKNSEVAETALWLSQSSMWYLHDPLIVNNVIELLEPLSDLHRSGWVWLLGIAAQIKFTSKVFIELDSMYDYATDLEDWARAKMAMTYAMATYITLGDNISSNAYLNRACSLLNGVKDDALRMITEAYVYDSFSIIGRDCPNTDLCLCKRLEFVFKGLEDLEKQAVSNPKGFLDAHPGLREYLMWFSLRMPEERISDIIRDAQGFALSGLGHCALNRGELEMAENYFKKAASAAHEAGNWGNYLNERRWAARAMALRALEEGRLNDVVKELEEFWNEALQKMESSTQYLEPVVGAFSDYLVALALVGRYEDVKELLQVHGSLLRKNERLSVASRLALKYLGVEVEVPTSKEMLNAIKDDVRPSFLSYLDEILSVPPQPIILLVSIRHDLITKLSNAGVPRELLERAQDRQLVEVSAPSTSLSYFILLLRALVLNDKDLALLHAEVGRALLKQGLVKRLFSELTDALRNYDEDGIRKSIAKLYYYHF